MKIKMPRAELLSSVGRDGHLVRQHAVLVVEDFQRARVLRFGRGALVSAGYQDRQSIVGGHAHLMGVDAGVDGARLLDLVARREVLVDAVDAHGTRIVKCYQDILRRNVGAHVDGARRQPYRRTVRRQSATRRIDAERGYVMLGPGRRGTWCAAAGRHIKIASRCMRPAILHGRRQRDRRTLDQLRTRDIHVVMREIGSDICIERELVGRRLGRSQPGRGNAACNK